MYVQNIDSYTIDRKKLENSLVHGQGRTNIKDGTEIGVVIKVGRASVLVIEQAFAFVRVELVIHRP